MNNEPVIHPCYTYVEEHGFPSLACELEKRVADGWINRRDRAVDGGTLSLYCYSKECTIERKWDLFTEISRGLVLFHPLDARCTGRVVAYVFPKFFNVGEKMDSIPDLPFEAFEKLDGSMTIAFFFHSELFCVTKGSFESEQAAWAKLQIESNHAMFSRLDRDSSYIFEAIYSENQIVLHYDFEGLVLLGGYDSTGVEYDRSALERLAGGFECRLPSIGKYDSVEELMEAAQTFGGDIEGFVLRFSNGYRLKGKGAEYCRKHRIISRLTPLSVWENMEAGTDMVAIRNDLPEEFWEDFDSIMELISVQRDSLIEKINKVVATTAGMTDKEVGLSLASYPGDVRSFIFLARRTSAWYDTPKGRKSVFREFRPTANVLAGYVPSVRFKKVQAELDEG